MTAPRDELEARARNAERRAARLEAAASERAEQLRPAPPRAPRPDPSQGRGHDDPVSTGELFERFIRDNGFCFKTPRPPLFISYGPPPTPDDVAAAFRTRRTPRTARTEPTA